jgi:hypothetical protein
MRLEGILHIMNHDTTKPPSGTLVFQLDNRRKSRCPWLHNTRLCKASSPGLGPCICIHMVYRGARVPPIILTFLHLSLIIPTQKGKLQA